MDEHSFNLLMFVGSSRPQYVFLFLFRLDLVMRQTPKRQSLTGQFQESRSSLPIWWSKVSTT